mmetsp:Transcript_8624/g.14586  ORF Transcript_8624/g.14586 Transcript_8624/m.14586 type:complete len:120 (-) Transcript_8624:88-447(-)
MNPMDLMGFLKNFTKADADGHINLSYYLDALSIKFFNIEYPTFCTIDLARLVQEKQVLQCGYEGDQIRRITPLHAQDPNLFYSFLRLVAPSIFGRHQLFYFDYKNLLNLLDFGLVYHKQ